MIEPPDGRHHTYNGLNQQEEMQHCTAIAKTFIVDFHFIHHFNSKEIDSNDPKVGTTDALQLSRVNL